VAFSSQSAIDRKVTADELLASGKLLASGIFQSNGKLAKPDCGTRLSLKLFDS
jgi:hypothetical protein